MMQTSRQHPVTSLAAVGLVAFIAVLLQEGVFAAPEVYPCTSGSVTLYPQSDSEHVLENCDTWSDVYVYPATYAKEWTLRVKNVQAKRFFFKNSLAEEATVSFEDTKFDYTRFENPWKNSKVMMNRVAQNNWYSTFLSATHTWTDCEFSVKNVEHTSAMLSSERFIEFTTGTTRLNVTVADSVIKRVQTNRYHQALFVKASGTHDDFNLKVENVVLEMKSLSYGNYFFYFNGRMNNVKVNTIGSTITSQAQDNRVLLMYRTYGAELNFVDSSFVVSSSRYESKMFYFYGRIEGIRFNMVRTTVEMTGSVREMHMIWLQDHTYTSQFNLDGCNVTQTPTRFSRVLSTRDSKEFTKSGISFINSNFSLLQQVAFDYYKEHQLVYLYGYRYSTSMALQGDFVFHNLNVYHTRAISIFNARYYKKMKNSRVSFKDITVVPVENNPYQGGILLYVYGCTIYNSDFEIKHVKWHNLGNNLWSQRVAYISPLYDSSISVSHLDVDLEGASLNALWVSRAERTNISVTDSRIRQIDRTTYISGTTNAMYFSDMYYGRLNVERITIPQHTCNCYYVNAITLNHMKETPIVIDHIETKMKSRYYSRAIQTNGNRFLTDCPISITNIKAEADATYSAAVYLVGASSYIMAKEFRVQNIQFQKNNVGYGMILSGYTYTAPKMIIDNIRVTASEGSQPGGQTLQLGVLRNTEVTITRVEEHSHGTMRSTRFFQLSMMENTKLTMTECVANITSRDSSVFSVGRTESCILDFHNNMFHTVNNNPSTSYYVKSRVFFFHNVFSNSKFQLHHNEIDSSSMIKHFTYVSFEYNVGDSQIEFHDLDAKLKGTSKVYFYFHQKRNQFTNTLLRFEDINCQIRSKSTTHFALVESRTSYSTNQPITIKNLNIEYSARIEVLDLIVKVVGGPITIQNVRVVPTKDSTSSMANLFQTYHVEDSAVSITNLYARAKSTSYSSGLAYLGTMRNTTCLLTANDVQLHSRSAYFVTFTGRIDEGSDVHIHGNTVDLESYYYRTTMNVISFASSNYDSNIHIHHNHWVMIKNAGYNTRLIYLYRDLARCNVNIHDMQVDLTSSSMTAMVQTGYSDVRGSKIHIYNLNGSHTSSVAYGVYLRARYTYDTPVVIENINTLFTKGMYGIYVVGGSIRTAVIIRNYTSTHVGNYQYPRSYMYDFSDIGLFGDVRISDGRTKAVSISSSGGGRIAQAYRMTDGNLHIENVDFEVEGGDPRALYFYSMHNSTVTLKNSRIRIVSRYASYYRGETSAVQVRSYARDSVILLENLGTVDLECKSCRYMFLFATKYNNERTKFIFRNLDVKTKATSKAGLYYNDEKATAEGPSWEISDVNLTTIAPTSHFIYYYGYRTNAKLLSSISTKNVNIGFSAGMQIFHFSNMYFEVPSFTVENLRATALSGYGSSYCYLFIAAWSKNTVVTLRDIYVRASGASYTYYLTGMYSANNMTLVMDNVDVKLTSRMTELVKFSSSVSQSSITVSNSKVDIDSRVTSYYNVRAFYFPSVVEDTNVTLDTTSLKIKTKSYYLAFAEFNHRFNRCKFSVVKSRVELVSRYVYMYRPTNSYRNDASDSSFFLADSDLIMDGSQSYIYYFSSSRSHYMYNGEYSITNSKVFYKGYIRLMYFQNGNLEGGRLTLTDSTVVPMAGENGAASFIRFNSVPYARKFAINVARSKLVAESTGTYSSWFIESKYSDLYYPHITIEDTSVTLSSKSENAIFHFRNLYSASSIVVRGGSFDVTSTGSRAYFTRIDSTATSALMDVSADKITVQGHSDARLLSASNTISNSVFRFADAAVSLRSTREVKTMMVSTFSNSTFTMDKTKVEVDCVYSNVALASINRLDGGSALNLHRSEFVNKNLNSVRLLFMRYIYSPTAHLQYASLVLNRVAHDTAGYFTHRDIELEISCVSEIDLGVSKKYLRDTDFEKKIKVEQKLRSIFPPYYERCVTATATASHPITQTKTASATLVVESAAYNCTPLVKEKQCIREHACKWEPTEKHPEGECISSGRPSDECETIGNDQDTCLGVGCYFWINQRNCTETPYPCCKTVKSQFACESQGCNWVGEFSTCIPIGASCGSLPKGIPGLCLQQNCTYHQPADKCKKKTPNDGKGKRNAGGSDRNKSDLEETEEKEAASQKKTKTEEKKKKTISESDPTKKKKVDETDSDLSKNDSSMDAKESVEDDTKRGGSKKRKTRAAETQEAHDDDDSDDVDEEAGHCHKEFLTGGNDESSEDSSAALVQEEPVADETDNENHAEEGSKDMTDQSEKEKKEEDAEKHDEEDTVPEDKEEQQPEVEPTSPEEPEEAPKKADDEQKGEEQPAEEQPAEEQPAEEQPAEEQPAEEQPAEEQPAEEQPAEEQPAEEQPAEEQPAEEQPAEEQPAEEQPAEEKPAEEDKDEDNQSEKKNDVEEEVEKLPCTSVGGLACASRSDCIWAAGASACLSDNTKCSELPAGNDNICQYVEECVFSEKANKCVSMDSDEASPSGIFGIKKPAGHIAPRESFALGIVGSRVPKTTLVALIEVGECPSPADFLNENILLKTGAYDEEYRTTAVEATSIEQEAHFRVCVRVDEETVEGPFSSIHVSNAASQIDACKPTSRPLYTGEHFEVQIEGQGVNVRGKVALVPAEQDACPASEGDYDGVLHAEANVATGGFLSRVGGAFTVCYMNAALIATRCPDSFEVESLGAPWRSPKKSMKKGKEIVERVAGVDTAVFNKVNCRSVHSAVSTHGILSHPDSAELTFDDGKKPYLGNESCLFVLAPRQSRSLNKAIKVDFTYTSLAANDEVRIFTDAKDRTMASCSAFTNKDDCRDAGCAFTRHGCVASRDPVETSVACPTRIQGKVLSRVFTRKNRDPATLTVNANRGAVVLVCAPKFNRAGAKGFHLTYNRASACPNDCSGNGKCDVRAARCSCKIGFSGEDCGQKATCATGRKIRRRMVSSVLEETVQLGSKACAMNLVATTRDYLKYGSIVRLSNVKLSSQGGDCRSEYVILREGGYRGPIIARYCPGKPQEDYDVSGIFTRAMANSRALYVQHRGTGQFDIKFGAIGAQCPGTAGKSGVPTTETEICDGKGTCVLRKDLEKKKGDFHENMYDCDCDKNYTKTFEYGSCDKCATRRKQNSFPVCESAIVCPNDCISSQNGACTKSGACKCVDGWYGNDCSLSDDKERMTVVKSSRKAKLAARLPLNGASAGNVVNAGHADNTYLECALPGSLVECSQVARKKGRKYSYKQVVKKRRTKRRSVAAKANEDVVQILSNTEDTDYGLALNQYSVKGEFSAEYIRQDNITGTNLDLAGEFTLVVWVKASPVTRGVLVAKIDSAFASNGQSPALEKALTDAASRDSAMEEVELYTEGLNVHIAVVLDGPNNRVALLVTDPSKKKSAAQKEDWMYVRHFNIEEDLFNDEWKLFALRVSDEKQRLEARVSVDGKSSMGPSHSQCIPFLPVSYSQPSHDLSTSPAADADTHSGNTLVWGYRMEGSIDEAQLYDKDIGSSSIAEVGGDDYVSSLPISRTQAIILIVVCAVALLIGVPAAVARVQLSKMSKKKSNLAERAAAAKASDESLKKESNDIQDLEDDEPAELDKTPSRKQSTAFLSRRASSFRPDTLVVDDLEEGQQDVVDEEMFEGLFLEDDIEEVDVEDITPEIVSPTKQQERLATPESELRASEVVDKEEELVASVFTNAAVLCASLTTIVCAWQIVGQMSFAMSAPQQWNSVFGKVAQVFSFNYYSNLGGNFASNYISVVVLSFVTAVAAAVCYKKVHVHSLTLKPTNTALLAVCASLWCLLKVLYMPLIEQSFVVVTCHPSISCAYDCYNDAEHRALAAIAFISLILMGLGIPVAVAAVCKANGSGKLLAVGGKYIVKGFHENDEETEETKMINYSVMGIVMSGASLRDGRTLFELFYFAFRCYMAALVVGMEAQSIGQLIASVVGQVVFALVSQVVYPYTTHFVNRVVYGSSLFALAMVMLQAGYAFNEAQTDIFSGMMFAVTAVGIMCSFAAAVLGYKYFASKH